MKDEARLRELAARARGERPPTVDVADRVMARLSQGRRAEAPAEDWQPMAWICGASAAAACAMAVGALGAWQLATDPLRIVLGSLTGSLS